MISAEEQSLRLPSPPLPACRAIVIIPARNEEESLDASLRALREQVDDRGHPLSPDEYEVLLLLNNCTDNSAQVARTWKRKFPDFCLHDMECTFAPEQAHVGSARHALMETACARFESKSTILPGSCILSTDADTTVAPDWIARNLQELLSGADAVGGVIEIAPEDLQRLDPGTHRAYRQDRLYQAAVARLESLLDPDAADPWPRHLQHFGASLACTPQIYRRAGGLPAVKPLEDVAFVDALRRCDARLRHSPLVRVRTSSRLVGRVEVGLSGQLGLWQAMVLDRKVHEVESCAWMQHRFSCMSYFRRVHQGLASSLEGPWAAGLSLALSCNLSPSAFLGAIDCNRLIEESFRGERLQSIKAAIADLNAAIDRHSARVHPVESDRGAGVLLASTQV